MKVVASRFVCGVAMLKTPSLAETVTGIVWLIHVFAVADPTSRVKAAAEKKFILRDVKRQYVRVLDTKSKRDSLLIALRKRGSWE